LFNQSFIPTKIHILKTLFPEKVNQDSSMISVIWFFRCFMRGNPDRREIEHYRRHNSYASSDLVLRQIERNSRRTVQRNGRLYVRVRRRCRAWRSSWDSLWRFQHWSALADRRCLPKKVQKAPFLVVVIIFSQIFEDFRDPLAHCELGSCLKVVSTRLEAVQTPSGLKSVLLERDPKYVWSSSRVNRETGRVESLENGSTRFDYILVRPATPSPISVTAQLHTKLAGLTDHVPISAVLNLQS
jgi:hypothetical protein